MNARTKIVTIVALLAALLALLWAAGSVTAQPPAQNPGGDEPGSIVSTWTHVQGRLYYQGNPAPDDTYSVRFRLYTAASAAESAFVWEETKDVTTSRSGLFSTYLAVDQGDFNGQALWLGIKVEADAEMTPRQPILPVPYALGLRPGALVSATANAVPVLRTYNSGSAAAFSGRSLGGNGIYGQSDVQDPSKAAIYGVALEHASGVYGESVHGYGISGKSQNSVGIYGESLFGTAAISGYAHDTGAGVYGESDLGIGVHGKADDVEAGVYGESVHGNGVHGKAGDGSTDAGVYGESIGGYGVQGTSNVGAGVYGDGGPAGDGVLGVANYGAGVHAQSTSGGVALYAEGNIVCTSKSFVWISGNDLVLGVYTGTGSIPTLLPDNGAGKVTTLHTSGSEYADTYLPITIPGVLYGQNVKLKSIRVYYKWNGTTGSIVQTKLTRLSLALAWETVVDDLTPRNSTTSTYYELAIPSAYQELSVNQGPLGLYIKLDFGSTASAVWINGVRLELEHY
ncbi:MAG: hypothetical protein KKA73_25790 [Chloroflexi bacterium]|nr:hypothetical protein [Chloroflexota bacterium]MBU1751111.1 hypothetical protein [Chloroflexota bacterium]